MGQLAEGYVAAKNQLKISNQRRDGNSSPLYCPVE
jgi:hypothetical protein